MKNTAKFEKIDNISVNVYGLSKRRVRRKECKEEETVDECEETIEQCSILTMSEGEEEVETDIEEENEEDRQFLDTKCLGGEQPAI